MKPNQPKHKQWLLTTSLLAVLALNVSWNSDISHIDFASTDKVTTQQIVEVEREFTNDKGILHRAKIRKHDDKTVVIDIQAVGTECTGLCGQQLINGSLDPNNRDSVSKILQAAISSKVTAPKASPKEELKDESNLDEIEVACANKPSAELLDCALETITHLSQKLATDEKDSRKATQKMDKLFDKHINTRLQKALKQSIDDSAQMCADEILSVSGKFFRNIGKEMMSCVQSDEFGGMRERLTSEIIPELRPSNARNIEEKITKMIKALPAHEAKNIKGLLRDAQRSAQMKDFEGEMRFTNEANLRHALLKVWAPQSVRGLTDSLRMSYANEIDHNINMSPLYSRYGRRLEDNPDRYIDLYLRDQYKMAKYSQDLSLFAADLKPVQGSEFFGSSSSGLVNGLDASLANLRTQIVRSPNTNPIVVMSPNSQYDRMYPLNNNNVGPVTSPNMPTFNSTTGRF